MTEFAEHESDGMTDADKPADERSYPLMTVRELALYLKVTQGSIYRMVKQRRIPVLRLGVHGRTLRFRRDQVEAWVNERRG